ncbi:YadA-like family protein [Negativicoccus succinicivorans]|uniref:YadA-like family protein n=1 Tax=Negativicoccus succinicivorans TaxID=620903 RepID=UPI00290780F6|nr:YadA-like family protein [Negativicoccus succinicivorans]MDU5530100.1 YadA-like family protein [Negativicoccus succinicivorans]
MNMSKKKKVFAALAAFSVLTGSAYAADTIVDITINQPYERTGLELGTDSYARGEGSIATGKNSVAIGKGATATGSNETAATIQAKLEENRAKLQEIEAKQKSVKQLGDELNALKIREQKTIEAGIRVEQIRKAKTNAKNVWDNAETAWQDKKAGTADAIAEHNRKLADLNSRLTGVSQLTHSDISTPEGLTAAAEELKGKAEQGTSMNLSVDFYKDYVTSYYKALGDLRLNNKIISEHGHRKILDQIRENPLHRDLDGIVLQYANPYNSSDEKSSSSSYYSPYYSSSSSYSSKSSSSSITAAHYNSLGTYSIDKNGIGAVTAYRDGGKQVYNGEIYQTYWNVKTDIIDQATFDKWNAAKEEWRAQIHDANRRSGDEVFGKFDTLTGGKSTTLFNMVTDMKFELVDLDYQICYYQGQYEATQDKTWLDKKKMALDLREKKLNTNEQTIKDKYQELFGQNLEDTSKLFYTIGQNIKNQWKQENIVAVEEKNKITTDKLTGELERELGINKAAIQQYEKEIQDLRDKADQARRNFEGLNPSEEDLILAREYERVAQELQDKADALKKAADELQDLKDNLKLNDLKDKGADAIAYGTNALVTGNAAIGIGKDVLVTGEDSIALGRQNTVSGTQSAAIGTNNTVTGNQTFVLGSGVTTAAQNAVILGAGSTGEDNTVSVGAASKERRIINVADPVKDHDAVNLKYLKDATEAIKNSIKPTVGFEIKAGDRIWIEKKEKESVAPHNPADPTDPAAPGISWGGNGKVVTPPSGDNDGYIRPTGIGNNMGNNWDDSNPEDPNVPTPSNPSETTGTNKIIYTIHSDDVIVNTKNDSLISVTKTDILREGSKENIDDKDDIVGKTYTLDTSKLQSVLDQKADANAINITGANKTAWQEKLGDGEVAEGDKGLVNGGTVYNAVKDKADTNLNNITEDGKTVIKDLAKGSVKVIDGENTTVKATTDNDGNMNYAVNVAANGKVEAGNTGIVSGDTVNKAITTVKQDVNAGLEKKANADATNITGANKDAWQEKLGDGKVAEGDKGLVTGDTVNTAIKGIKDDVNTSLEGKADTNLNNITEDGKTVIKNIAQDSVKVIDGTNTTVTETTDNDGNKNYAVNVEANGKVEAGNTGIVSGDTVNKAITTVKQDVNADLNKKADANAENITGTNKTAWQEKLGDGKVAEGDKGLVTGNTVYDAVKDKADKSDITNAVKDKADINLNNITVDGKTVIKNIAKDSVKVIDGTNTTVTETTDNDGNKNYAVNVEANGKAAAGNTGLISGDTLYKAIQDVDVSEAVKNKANTNLNNITVDGKTVIKNIAKDSVKVIDGANTTVTATTDKDGNKNYAVNVAANGKVEAGNTGIVNGGTVYESVKNKADKKDLLNLATVTQQQLVDLDGRMRNGLAAADNKINQTGALAAALAGMKPLDYDGTERTQISAAVGQYHNKHAVALGAYHYFNRDLLLSGGLAWQGSDVMANVGVTLRVGKRDEGAISRNADVKELADEVIELRKQNKDINAQLEDLLAQIKVLKGSKERAQA